MKMHKSVPIVVTKKPSAKLCCTISKTWINVNILLEVAAMYMLQGTCKYFQ
jgi:hypothetical protein